MNTTISYRFRTHSPGLLPFPAPAASAWNDRACGSTVTDVDDGGDDGEAPAVFTAGYGCSY